MDVQLTVEEETMTAFLSGEIDHHGAGEIRRKIDEMAQRVRPQKMILDFGGVTFMDSSGIGLVMGRYRLLQSFGGALCLRHVSSPLKKVMRLAGLDRIAQIEDTRPGEKQEGKRS
ncbi:MAG: anti-sigma factor antagonist [Oscillospiraceae bacterium]|nr:anti-sigma factor antagonist [Oscillospiraceae bacterium]